MFIRFLCIRIHFIYLSFLLVSHVYSKKSSSLLEPPVSIPGIFYISIIMFIKISLSGYILYIYHVCQNPLYQGIFYIFIMFIRTPYIRVYSIYLSCLLEPLISGYILYIYHVYQNPLYQGIFYIFIIFNKIPYIRIYSIYLSC